MSMADFFGDVGDFFSDVGDKAKDMAVGRDVPTTRVLGVGNIGEDPTNVEDEYQRRVRELYSGQSRNEERFQAGLQENRILGAMQPSTVASQAARAQAMEAGQQTLGAASSAAGAAGIQTAGLGGLGAGAAQQYGMQAAAQVTAQEQQRNALAQAQMAELLRQQRMSSMGLERADYAQALGSSRALLAPELAQQAEAAQNEAARQERQFGAAVGAIGSGASYAFSPSAPKRP